MTRLVGCFIVLSVWLCVAAAGFRSAWAESLPRVLYLDSYHAELPWSRDLLEGFNSTVAGQGRAIRLRVEHLDSKRQWNPDYQARLRDLYAQKFADDRFDVIIAADNNAFTFINTFFESDPRFAWLKAVPKIFIGLNNPDRAFLDRHRDWTGMVEVTDVRSNVALALELFPKTKNLFLLHDQTPSGLAIADDARDQLIALNGILDVQAAPDLPLGELKKHLATLADDTLVIALHYHREPTGRFVNEQTELADISRLSARPVFPVFRHFLGGDMIGGMVQQGEQHGRFAAERLFRILDGMKPEDLPIIWGGGTNWVFNWNGLQRFGISPKALPDGHGMINRPAQEGLENEYWVRAGFFSAGFVVIGGLLVALFRARQERSRQQFNKREAELENAVSDRTHELVSALVALRSSKDSFAFLYNAAPVMMHSIDQDGVVVQVSDFWLDHLGYSRDEVVGRPLSAFMPESQREAADSEVLPRFLRDGRLTDEPLMFQHADGDLIEVLTTAVIEKDREGQYLRSVSVSVDVTERNQMVAALAENEQRYREIFEASRAVMLLINPENGEICDANRAAAEFYGWSIEDLREMSITDINCLSPEQVAEEMARAQTEKRNYFQFIHRLKSGSTRDVEVHSGPIHISGQNLLYSIIHDITDRRHAEEALRDSREQLALALSGAGAGLWDYNIQTSEVFFSDGYLALYGYTRTEVTPDYEFWRQHLHPEDAPRTLRSLIDHIEGRSSSYEAEFRFKTKDGNWIWSMARGRIVSWTEEGAPLRLVGIQSDITEQKEAAETLRVNEQRLELALKGGGAGLWDLNLKTGEIIVNDTLLAIYGSEPHRTKTSMDSWQARVHPEDLPPALEAMDAHLSGEKDFYEAEYRFAHGNGSWVWSMARGRIVSWNWDGTPLRMVGTQTDISVHKALEEELFQAKLTAESANRAKSEFLANMSHELRTPLNAILGFSEMIQSQIFGPLENDRYRDYVNDIHDSGAHLLELITDILDIAKIEAGRMEIDPTLFPPANVLMGSVRMMAIKAETAGLVLEAHLEDNLPLLYGDERACKQILFNLLSNSIKYTESRGTITVKARALTDGGIEIQVIDNGIGIPPNKLQQVLKPFEQVDNRFNRETSGTGLGLALVKALMDLHEGQFMLESQEGVGTTATLRFLPPPTSIHMDSEDLAEAGE